MAQVPVSNNVVDFNDSSSYPSYPVDTNAGVATNATQRIVIASDQTALPVTMISPQPQVDVLTTSTTWTKPTNARYHDVYVIGEGGPGGSGRKGAAASTRTGGAGGQAGYVAWARYLASQLGATETCTFLGTVGVPGASVTTNSTNGNAGVGGISALFGGTLPANSKLVGGAGSPGTGGATGTIAGISAINGGSNVSIPYYRGASGGSSGGAGGGGGQADAFGSGNAGGGGAISSANAGLNAGTAALRSGYYIAASGITAGGKAVDTGAGNNGVDGATPGINVSLLDDFIFSGSGDGGAAGLTVNAGKGGNGGFPGGAGGGGGASVDSVSDSGAGGLGGAAAIIIITYF